MATIYLAAVKAWTGAAETTLYFSSAPYVTAPTGSPANTWYDDRIKQPAYLRRDAWGNRRTSGASAINVGELVLLNSDGGLDGLDDYEFDGRAITLTVGSLTRKGGTPTWTTVLAGVVEQANFAWREITFRIREAYKLDVPIQSTKFAGTNSLPSGLEGLPTDIQGKPKPKVYGTVNNVSPPLVNTSRLIYQVNDAAVADVPAVYDGGAAMSRAGDYASQADMETNAPLAGYYRVWRAGGYFRLGSSPNYQITADVVQGASASVRTVAQVIKAIVTGPGGVPVGSVSASDISTLDAANSATVGVWCGEETTISEQLDILANTVGAFWGFDRSGTFRVQQLLIPAGSPAITLTDVDIVAIERTTSKDADRGLPSWRVKLRHSRYYTVQTSGLAGTLSASRRGEVGQEYREVVAEDASVKTAHAAAVETVIDTAFTAASDATTEATRRLGMYKVRRDLYEVTVALQEGVGVAVDLGSVVAIDIARYGMGGGRLFRVVGIRPDLQRSRLDLTLWG